MQQPTTTSTGTGNDAAVAGVHHHDNDELERLKSECVEMIKMLKRLESEEEVIKAQNEVLAREALLCGFDPIRLEPPAPKRRKSATSSAAASAAKQHGGKQ